MEEKVGKSVNAMLEQKCGELAIELERADFAKKSALFDLEKASLELKKTKQKEQELEQRVMDLETKHGNLVAELENEKDGRVTELEAKVENDRRLITSLREELHN